MNPLLLIRELQDLAVGEEAFAEGVVIDGLNSHVGIDGERGGGGDALENYGHNHRDVSRTQRLG